MRRTFQYAILCVLALLVSACSLAPTAWAQKSGQTKAEFEGVGIERKHGTVIPQGLLFRNAEGEEVTLGSYFDGERPVILNLVYHECPMLCGLMMNGVTQTLSDLAWTPGDQFDVLTVSFNHRETPEIARRQKERYLNELGKPGAEDGWHFLTGSEASIEALTEAVGFNFKWVPEKQEYAHPTAMIFLSGTGKVTRYIYGMQLPAGDTRKALVEASDGKVGNPIDQVALYCFQFDPNENSYTADAFNLMRLGGTLTVIVLGVALFFFWRRERENLDRARTDEPVAAP